MARLELKFSRQSGAAKAKGPFERLRFEAEVIRASEGGPVIGRHRNHCWEVDGEAYTRLDCDRRLTVHFERVDGSKSATYGPYESFSCVDGVAYVDHQVFAFADRAIVDWYCTADATHWPLMIVEAA